MVYHNGKKAVLECPVKALTKCFVVVLSRSRLPSGAASPRAGLPILGIPANCAPPKIGSGVSIFIEVKEIC